MKEDIMSDKRYQEEYLRRIHKVQDYIEQHTGDYHSMNLYNGTAVLNIALPENANVGDRFNYTCIITDTMVEKEFCESFEIVVEEKKEDNGGNGGHRNPLRYFKVSARQPDDAGESNKYSNRQS